MAEGAKTFLISMLAVVALSLHLPAHEVLGPVEVNGILKEIQRSKVQLASTESSDEDREKARFHIAGQAFRLMKLINEERRAHGNQEQGLIDLAVSRCRAMGVEIAFDQSRDLYLYDFQEFEEYLKLYPNGRFEAEVRYALIERSALQKPSGERTLSELEGQAESKRKLLQEFPGFEKRPDIEMLLALDYYELYALSGEQRDRQGEMKYKKLTAQQFRHIVESYPGSQAADYALRLLMRFDK